MTLNGSTQDNDATIEKDDNLYRWTWESIEAEVLSTPGMNLLDVAERYNIPVSTVYKHGGGTAGRWVQRRQEKLRDIGLQTHDRYVELLAQERMDDVTALQAIQLRLQSAALSMIELLFPPPDAPLEALEAARIRLDAMTGKQIASVATDCARTLTETGRHIRLLTGKSTAIFGRAGSPSDADAWIPLDIEEAQALEMRSRMAQSALRALADGSPVDVAFRLIPPDFADSPVPVATSARSPVSLNAQKAGVSLDCVTSKADADELGL